MRKMIVGLSITCLILMLLVLPASAQAVTADDARSVAQNWVALTIRQQGDWGGSPSAQIGEVREFRLGGRHVGYFCQVSPQGFLVMSLRRELAPVKVYSDISNLDPDSDEGMTGLVKQEMAAILDGIEKEAGPVESVSSEAVTPLMEFNYLGAWDILETGTPASGDQIAAVAAASNYQQGGVMLSSGWHQGEPYWNSVPVPSSATVCPDAHCAVGCVATAGAQIMKFWDWPPYGSGTPYSDTYDWPHMANRYVWCNAHLRWEDENNNALAQASLDAVAELGREVGQAVGMDYCADDPPLPDCESSAITADMEGVYENNFRYASAANRVDRSSYTAVSWFTMLKDQFNQNRAVQYRILRHSIVGDGWRERLVGSTLVREYHMNYGWDDSNNAWFALDGLNQVGSGTISDEYVVRDIFPAQALGNTLSGTYPLQGFPYRYFDRDTAGNSATFSAGQYLQFLPGVKATCNSGTGNSIRIEGTSSALTRVFARGDPSRGIHIHAGILKMDPGGSLRFR